MNNVKEYKQRFDTLDDVMSIGTTRLNVPDVYSEEKKKRGYPRKFIQRGSFSSHFKIQALGNDILVSKLREIAE